jgi:hypothetical protein
MLGPLFGPRVAKCSARCRPEGIRRVQWKFAARLGAAAPRVPRRLAPQEWEAVPQKHRWPRRQCFRPTGSQRRLLSAAPPNPVYYGASAGRSGRSKIRPNQIDYEIWTGTYFSLSFSHIYQRIMVVAASAMTEPNELGAWSTRRRPLFVPDEELLEQRLLGCVRQIAGHPRTGL